MTMWTPDRREISAIPSGLRPMVSVVRSTIVPPGPAAPAYSASSDANSSGSDTTAL
jgi:hypothetical protein